MSKCNENFYTTLKCDISASYDDLKRSYQQLIKIYHPDKLESAGQDESNEMFQKIDKAWKTLRDPKLRKEYDATLMCNDFNQDNLIYAHVNVQELIFKKKNSLSYPCRCGSYFVVDKSELETNTLIVIECNECTNCICVKNS